MNILDHGLPQVSISQASNKQINKEAIPYEYRH